MLTIKVLGPGCQNCQTLADKAKEALEAVAESSDERPRDGLSVGFCLYSLSNSTQL